MKKLVILFVLLAIFGCKDRSTNKQVYLLEKEFFRAWQITRRIMINPRIAPIPDFEKAERRYKHVLREIEKLPPEHQDQTIIKNSLLTLAQLKIFREDPQDAIRYYEQYLRRFDGADHSNLSVKVNLALLYQRVLSYHKAAAIYNDILEDVTRRIDPADPKPYLLSIPFQFAKLEEMSTTENGTAAAFSRVTRAYETVMKKWPGSQAASQALQYLAILTLEKQQYRTLSRILDQQIGAATDSAFHAQLLYFKGEALLGQPGREEEGIRLLRGVSTDFANMQVARAAQLELAKYDIKQGRYAAARKILSELLAQPGDFALGAVAQEQLALSYELEGLWDKALNEYRWLAKQYETTPQALAAPIKIANHYLQLNNQVVAAQAFKDAVTYYQELVRKYPQSMLAAMAQEQIGKCYLAQQKYEMAAEAVKKIREIWDNRVGVISTYLLLGKVYEASRQYELAAKAYNELAEQFPTHPLAELFKQRAKQLLQ